MAQHRRFQISRTEGLLVDLALRRPRFPGNGNQMASGVWSAKPSGNLLTVAAPNRNHHLLAQHEISSTAGLGLGSRYVGAINSIALMYAQKLRRHGGEEVGESHSNEQPSSTGKHDFAIIVRGLNIKYVTFRNTLHLGSGL